MNQLADCWACEAEELVKDMCRQLQARLQSMDSMDPLYGGHICDMLVQFDTELLMLRGRLRSQA